MHLLNFPSHSWYSDLVIMIGCILLCIASIASLSATTNDADKAVISVDTFHGHDYPSCLSGYGHCRCLSYVLNHSVQKNVSLIVDITFFEHNYEKPWCDGDKPLVEYDLQQSNVTFKFTAESTVDRFVGFSMHYIQFTNFEKLTFKVPFVEKPFLKDGNLVEFLGCTFFDDTNPVIETNNNNIKIKYSSLQKVVFSNCTFAPLVAHEDLFYFREFSFQNIQNLFFVDCYFKIHYDLGNVLLQFSQCINVTFCSCSFMNNSKISIYASRNFAPNEYAVKNLIIKNCSFMHNQVFPLRGLILAAPLVLEISNTIFAHNQITSYGSNKIEALVMIDGCKLVTFANVTFQSNVGLGIYISTAFAGNTSLNFINLRFINNTGVKAAGIFLSYGRFNYAGTLSFVNISFQANHYIFDYGGGVFIQSPIIFYKIYKINLRNIHFQDEQQGVSSNSIDNMEQLFPNISKKYWRLPASHIKVRNTSTNFPIMFPGKFIPIPPLVITDWVNNKAKCSALLSIANSNDNSSCKLDIRNNAQERTSILLESTSVAQIKSFYFTSTYQCLFPQTEIALSLDCENASVLLNFTLRECPLGYTFNATINSMGTCQEASDQLVYDKDTGAVCVQNSNWYGQMGTSNTIISSCTDPYCASGKACPVIGFTDTHQTLPWTQDEQCKGLYGGLMCRSCKENCIFTFGASKCILSSDCKEEWQPYLIISLAVAGQIALALVLICSVGKSKSGVGYLYGPLFFFAVYKLLPLSHSYLQNTSPLEYTVSLYESILLLDLDILGKVSWCFFPTLNQTLNYTFRFLGPLITFTVLLVIVLIARINFCYRLRINRIIQSPIQPMCLLIVLSFWSLSKTSMEILKPVIIEGRWRFAIQPQYQYFGNAYTIALFCIAVSLLVFVYLPFILLLLFSQSLRAKVSMVRIQPLLDAFQSSYRDKCRWYSGVYLLVWVVLNINMPAYAFIVLTAAVVLLHSLVQPHKSMFLNATDAFLLMDMMVLSSLSYYCSDDGSSTAGNITTILKYPLLIVPLLYILAGGVWMAFGSAIVKCWKVVSELLRPRNDKLLQELATVASTDEEAMIDSGDIDVHEYLKGTRSVISMMEREPLIYDDN